MALEAPPEKGALWLDNLVPRSSVAAFSTRRPEFPASNLISPLRSSRWRTRTSSLNAHVVFDLGADVVPACLALIDINFSAGTKIRFRGSNDAAQVIQPVFFDFELYPEDPVQRVVKWYVGDTPTGGSMDSGKRFWGVRILPPTFGDYGAVDEEGNPADYFEIGAVWIGTSYEEIDVSDDVGFTPRDPSDRQRAAHGAQWTDQARPHNELAFAVEHLALPEFYALKRKIVRQGSTETIVDLHANSADPAVKARSAHYGCFAPRPCTGRVSSPEDASLRISFEEASG